MGLATTVGKTWFTIKKSDWFAQNRANQSDAVLHISHVMSGASAFLLSAKEAGVKYVSGRSRTFILRLEKWFDWNYIKKVIKATTALGHSSPKREQCNTVKQFVSGHDVFISLPTGGGKIAV